MDLKSLLEDNATTIQAIAEYLDGLTHDARIAQTRSLNRAQQRKLFAIAGTGPVITLEHFVGAGVSAREPVRHFGRNTLPLPNAHKNFEKRFCRPDENGDTRLFGYNETASRKILGPGFFVAIPTDGNADWVGRGGVVIDYFQVPDGPVSEGWPEVVPNSKGVQRFVYHKTRDFMRKVSEHVSIGEAYKVEKSLGQFFVLCRESS